MRQYHSGLILVLLLFLPGPTTACSMQGCLGNGIEMRANFSVRVLIDGKPLPGVTVEVTSFGSQNAEVVFLGTTNADGIARVRKLTPGTYWLHTDFLGVSAGERCFHVSAHASWKTKRKITYDWADSVPASRHLAGKLIDSQPGKSGKAVWDLIHRVDVPIKGARLILQDPLSGKITSTVSDDQGRFEFDSVPEGIYVLHIDKGIAPGGREYDSTDLQIRLSNTATRDSLLIKHREAGGGSCGGTSLELH